MRLDIFWIIAQPHRPLFSELTEEDLSIAEALEELATKTEEVYRCCNNPLGVGNLWWYADRLLRAQLLALIRQLLMKISKH